MNERDPDSVLVSSSLVGLEVDCRRVFGALEFGDCLDADLPAGQLDGRKSIWRRITGGFDCGTSAGVAVRYRQVGEHRAPGT